MAKKSSTKTKKPLGLYIHIPFCKSKCSYCDFCSYVNTDQRVVDHYINSLILQAEDFASQCKKEYYVNSIYFGGGTPSLIPVKQIARILDCIVRLYTVSKNAEITLEMNPATVNGDYLKKLRKAGVNRLSIGMQSANDNELKSLGRIHTFEDFVKTYNAARYVGFENINIDVMYGIPGQTKESFSNTLDRIVELEPEHVSIYALKLEEGTPMYKMQENLVFPDDDDQFEMYCDAINKLKKINIEPYEISNFSIDGYESAHNIKYWLGSEYIGLGVAAHSYFKGERFEATKNIKTYVYAMELVKKKIPIYVSYEKIGTAEAAKEFFMLGMRLYEGIERQEFEEKFGIGWAELFLDPLKDYVEEGYVKIENGIYSFTEKGMFVSSYIISDVLEIAEANREKNPNIVDETRGRLDLSGDELKEGLKS